MSARLIDLDEVTGAHEAAWRALAARAAVPNPFFEADAVLAAHRHLPAGGALLVCEQDGRWLACLPVVGARAALRSWRHDYAFLGMPLVDADAGADALADLLRDAVARSPTRLAVLEMLPADGHAGRLVRSALQCGGLGVVYARAHARARLDRRANPAEYFAHHGRHHRREANRLARRLGDELGGELEVTDRAGDEAAVHTFLELEQSGWKGHAGTAMGATPQGTAFFADLCTRFHAAGRLQLLALHTGERTVAMKCNLAAGEGIFCFKIARDAAFDRFSPGVRLERDNVAVFHEQRAERWMDSCADRDNVMINRLWPDRRRICSAVVGRRDLRTGAIAATARVAVDLRGRARSAPHDWRTRWTRS